MKRPMQERLRRSQYAGRRAGWSSPIGHPIRREVTYCRNHPPAPFWDSFNEGVGLLSLADAMASSSPSAVHLLHRAAQLAVALFVRNVTPRQFEILKAAAAVDGLSQTAIMATTGIDRSSTGPLVSKLVRMGLLQCRRTRKYIEHIPSG